MARSDVIVATNRAMEVDREVTKWRISLGDPDDTNSQPNNKGVHREVGAGRSRTQTSDPRHAIPDPVSSQSCE